MNRRDVVVLESQLTRVELHRSLAETSPREQDAVDAFVEKSAVTGQSEIDAGSTHIERPGNGQPKIFQAMDCRERDVAAR